MDFFMDETTTFNLLLLIHLLCVFLFINFLLYIFLFTLLKKSTKER